MCISSIFIHPVWCPSISGQFSSPLDIQVYFTRFSSTATVLWIYESVLEETNTVPVMLAGAAGPDVVKSAGAGRRRQAQAGLGGQDTGAITARSSGLLLAWVVRSWRSHVLSPQAGLGRPRLTQPGPASPRQANSSDW